jgi:hypothetical protein
LFSEEAIVNLHLSLMSVLFRFVQLKKMSFPYLALFEENRTVSNRNDC